MSISGFGNGRTFVKVQTELGLGTDEIEIDPGLMSLRDGGLAVITTAEDGARTQWWVPQDRVLYLRQDQGVPQGAPAPPATPVPTPEPEEPQAPPVG